MTNTWIVLSLLVLLCASSRSTASRQVILSCGPDEEDNRGFPGAPGKRGATGLPGQKGEAGVKGEKGQSDDSRDSIARMERRFDQLENQLTTANQTIAELKRKVQQSDMLRRRNCDEIYESAFTEDGVYTILLGGKLVEIFCEFQKNGHNWLILQRRSGGSQDFYKGWQEYSSGFGRASGEYWLGLENLHAITTSAAYRLRVDLEDWNGNTAYAEYRVFSVGSSSTNYRLTVGGYSGTAGNAMSAHNSRPFTTKDRDNDAHDSANCAVNGHGAWWYVACYHSNLNGRYMREQNNCHGLGWLGFPGSIWCNSMKKSEMKIRPN